MRQIKFRAWFKDKKEMREVAMLRWEDERMSRIAGYDLNTHNNGWTDYDPASGKTELMQFTGLLDKNGKEIYEGDIVKSISNTDRFVTFRPTSERKPTDDDPRENWHFDQNIEGVVEWLDGSFVIRCKDSGFVCLIDIFYGKHEVIGNIYENPDLLE